MIQYNGSTHVRCNRCGENKHIGALNIDSNAINPKLVCVDRNTCLKDKARKARVFRNTKPVRVTA